MSDEKRYKLVDGELVELTPEDLAQIEKDAAEAAKQEPEPKDADRPKRK